MKRFFFVVCLLLSLSSNAQTYTLCSDCDTINGRDRNYYYSEWYDTCACYLNGQYDTTVSPLSNMSLDTPVQCYGVVYAKQMLVSQPLKVKGIMAMVDIYAKHYFFRDTIKLPEYVYLYQKIENDSMLLLDSARWDTIKPHYMKLRLYANEERYVYCYAYDAYFDKPVLVDSVFYVAGSTNSNYYGPTESDPNPAFSYIPTIYRTVRDVGDCEPVLWGQTRERFGDNWYWFIRDGVTGYYLPIVDNWEVTVRSSDSTTGAAGTSGYYPDGHTVTIWAEPQAGYAFAGWNDGNGDNPRQFTVLSDTVFAAISRPARLCNVTVMSNDETLGTVSGGGQYYEGDTATLTATPAGAHCAFVMWSDSIVDNPRRLKVVQDTAMEAVFVGGIGVGEVTGPSVSIAPNPARQQFSVSCDEPILQLTVRDASGRTVCRQSPGGSVAIVDAALLPTCIYIVTVATARGEISKKVAVER